MKRVWFWWARPSTLAVDFHRFHSRWFYHRPGIRRRLADIGYRLFYPVIEGWTGVSLPRQVRVGKNLRIFHRGKVVVNELAVIGDDVSIVHGVTIGNRVPGGGAPVIGDRVEIGAYAQVLGPISVGEDAKIGSMAVVIDDVPPGATVVPQKARIIVRVPDGSDGEGARAGGPR